MQTMIDEIGERIYRLSTFVPHIMPPAGFTFNQFLILADQPLLFHTGLRKLFPSVCAAVGKLMPIDQLRWITFGHYEADECGAMNDWLAAAPRAEIAHGLVGCMVSLNDMADRPPRVLANGEVLDIGGRRIRYIDTPHVPHGWDAGVIFEETTSTLFCGDLFSHGGNGPALTTGDIVGPAIAMEEASNSTCLTPGTARSIRGLAALAPRTLAAMHGSSFSGDAASALTRLADFYGARLTAALAA